MIFFYGCSDGSTVNIFDKKITQKKIECMRLAVFPPNEMIKSTLNKLYSFDDKCSLTLDVSSSSAIVCNSNQNSQKKALSNFPTSYLKMQIKDKHLLYSYYIDLSSSVASEDVEDGFKRIKQDINFKKQ